MFNCSLKIDVFFFLGKEDTMIWWDESQNEVTAFFFPSANLFSLIR